MAPARKEIQHSVHQCDTERIFIRQLPDRALAVDEIVTKASSYDQLNTHFSVDKGRVSGAVYTQYRNADHLQLLTEVSRKLDPVYCSLCRCSSYTPSPTHSIQVRSLPLFVLHIRKNLTDSVTTLNSTVEWYKLMLRHSIQCTINWPSLLLKNAIPLSH